MNYIKQWILNRKFIFQYIQDKIKDAEMSFHIKNFKAAQKDILETMNDDLEEKAEVLAKEKLANLLSVVDMDKIVTIDKQKGIVFVGGERIDDARLANLKSEAEALSQFDLWHLITETPKELAHKAMFVSGENLADMQRGRSMLYTLANQQNIVNLFKGYISKK